MLLQLTKNTGKPHIIKYIRDNGTETWMYGDEFFVRHDLSHYAIETVLSYTTAFIGMLNRGMDIKDFENREKRKAILVTEEAFYTENMANLFLTEILQDEFDDFNSVQQQAFGVFGDKFPAITLPAGAIDQVRLRLRQLLDQWNELPEDATMELQFSL